MDGVIGYLGAFPMIITFYLIFFQTQKLWKTRKYSLYLLLSISFGILWILLPIKSLNKKLFIAPFYWALTCLICQQLHNKLSSPELRDKPLIFVKYMPILGRDAYDKRLGRKPGQLDRVSSIIVTVGFLVLLFFSIPLLRLF
jgi:hypothetical protein